MSGGEYQWRGGFCLEVKPVPNTIVIFGASGDLSNRKLIPALYSLFRKKLLHEKSRIIGCARTPMDDGSWRDLIRGKLAPSADLDSFLSILHYEHGDYSDPAFYRNLSRRLDSIEKEADADPLITGRVFYAALPSSLYGTLAARLGESGLTKESSSGVPWRHVIFEKPFGHDLESAQKLDAELHNSLEERQIYRMDHYLGKETVQNILILRFANMIFEPVWNSHYIDNIQITVAETVGVEHRAGYFDKAGLLRDIFQNHMLEMLSLVTMECPSSSDPDAIRDEKLKLLKSIRPFKPADIASSVIRGQYIGYHDEPGIPADSETETFAAMRLFIDNWRWQGVPVILRSGKKMAKKQSRITITFKHVPHSIFSPVPVSGLTPNQLVLDVQPQEGLTLKIQAKEPGPKLCMGQLSMDFKYSSILENGESMPDAYERLLLDCMLGDQTLFIRSDTIDCAWKLLAPILEAWKHGSTSAPPLYPYQQGSWGPKEADSILIPHNIFWQNEND